MLALSPTGESGGAELNNGNYDIKGVNTAQRFGHGTEVGNTW